MREREWMTSGLRIIRPSLMSLRTFWRELALAMVVASLGSSQILRLPHLSTLAARRFCTRRDTLKRTKKGELVRVFRGFLEAKNAHGVLSCSLDAGEKRRKEGERDFQSTCKKERDAKRGFDQSNRLELIQSKSSNRCNLIFSLHLCSDPIRIPLWGWAGVERRCKKALFSIVVG